MAPELRANSVEVAKVWQARCKVPGCGWQGSAWLTYESANAERTAHLEEHRQEARDGG